MATRGSSADCLTLRASALATRVVSDIAIFVLKRDVKLQLTNLATRGPSADYLTLRDPYPLMLEVASPIPRLLQDVNSIAVEFRMSKAAVVGLL